MLLIDSSCCRVLLVFVRRRFRLTSPWVPYRALPYLSTTEYRSILVPCVVLLYHTHSLSPPLWRRSYTFTRLRLPFFRIFVFRRDAWLCLFRPRRLRLLHGGSQGGCRILLIFPAYPRTARPRRRPPLAADEAAAPAVGRVGSRKFLLAPAVDVCCRTHSRVGTSDPSRVQASPRSIPY